MRTRSIRVMTWSPFEPNSSLCWSTVSRSTPACRGSASLIPHQRGLCVEHANHMCRDIPRLPIICRRRPLASRESVLSRSTGTYVSWAVTPRVTRAPRALSPFRIIHVLSRPRPDSRSHAPLVSRSTRSSVLASDYITTVLFLSFCICSRAAEVYTSANQLVVFPRFAHFCSTLVRLDFVSPAKPHMGGTWDDDYSYLRVWDWKLGEL